MFKIAVTIKQIAEEAHVCRATVDKVLHNRPGVSPELTKRVQKVIKDLGYQPNIIGQALKRQNKTVNIAAVLLSLDSLQYLISGINKEAQSISAFGFKVTSYVTAYPDVAAQQHLLDSMIDSDTAAVILTPFDDPRIANSINRLRDAGKYVITINSDCPDSRRNFFIGQNMYQAGRTAAQLVEMTSGNSGTAAVLMGSIFASFDNDRFHGFKSYLESKNSLKIVDVVNTDEQPRKTYEQTMLLLQRHPDLTYLFITCGCVNEAVRAVSDLQARVHIVCFDSFPENTYLIKSGLIDFIIDQDLPRQGELAVHYLFEQLCLKNTLPSGNIYMPIRIHTSENIDY